MKKQFAQFVAETYTPEDNIETKTYKYSFTLLTLSTSVGALFWTLVCLFAGAPYLSLISLFYLLISAGSIYYFHRTKSFRKVRSPQVGLAIVLPFLFQAAAGGIQASGTIMIWSVVSFVGLLTCGPHKGTERRIFLFGALCILTTVSDPFFAERFPPLFRPEVANAFMAFNFTACAFSLYLLAKYFIAGNHKVKRHLSAHLDAVDRTLVSFEFSPKGKLLKINKLGREFLGYSEEECKNLNFRDLYAEEDRISFLEKLFASGTGRAVSGESVFKTKKGDELWFFTTILPVYYSSGKVQKYLNLGFDITERKLAEKRLENRRKQTEQILDALPVGVFLKNDRRKFVFVNKKMAELTGKSPEMFLESSSEELFPAQMVSYLRKEESSSEEQPAYFELELSKKNKTQFLLSGKKTIPGQGGRKLLLGFLLDVTDRRRAELELRSAFEKLQVSEEELRQNTEELAAVNELLSAAGSRAGNLLEKEKKQRSILEKTYKELKETQAQLVQNERLAGIGQLTAGLAHELNNPLNFITGGTGALRSNLEELISITDMLYKTADEDTEPADLLEKCRELLIDLDYPDFKSEIFALIGDINRGAERSMDVVKNLRLFARIDEDVTKKVNIHENLDATLALLDSIKGENVQMVKKYDPALPEILCHPGQLNQVFLQILLNAFQAVEKEKEGIICLRTEQKSRNGRPFLLISIKDNGHGMSEQVRKQIFDPFFTTREVGDGRGLGLSAAIGIVRRHEGYLEVESTEGEGSEFVIGIPVKD